MARGVRFGFEGWRAPWLVAALALGLAAGVRAAPLHEVEGVAEYRLDNGLQVLLVRDDSKPTTTVNLTVKVGSRHENYGETGMAHLLEHMLFKGTPRHPTVWAEFDRRGLRANGSTWLDRTNYFASFSSQDDNLGWYLDWLADALVNSRIDRADLDAEMTVVRNEMEVGENDPTGILYEKTVAAAYQWHGYGRSTIGARADVEAVDIERLRTFYRAHYRPDNATLIVAGRFDPARVLAWIDAGFGRIARPQAAMPAIATLDPAQDGEREVTLRRVGGIPVLLAVYHVPPAAHPDYAAVELLGAIAADAPSGRLHRRLVQQGLAAQVFAWPHALAEPGFVMFGAQLAPGQDAERARAAFVQTIESLAGELVTAEELERARRRWLKQWDMQFSNPETVGVALSEAIAQGDWRLYFLQRDRVRAAPLDLVRRVAGAYLQPTNRTVGRYLPMVAPQRAPAPARVVVGEQVATFVPKAAEAAVAPFDASPANLERQVRRFELAGGAKLAVLPKPTRGRAVHATMLLHYGDEASLAGRAEIESLVARTLDKSAAGLTRQQIQDRLDALGTELSFEAGAGRLVVRMQTRSEHLAEAIGFVVTLLRRPAFDAAAFAEVRAQVRAEIEAARSDPEALVTVALARHGDPFPRGHVRHARDFDERLQDLEGATPGLLRELHARLYGASDLRWAFVGDLDADVVRTAAERALQGWQAPVPYARVPDPWRVPPGTRALIVTPDKQNAVLGAVQRIALSDHDAQYPAFMLASHLLGGGGDSRLWKRIRERDGLSYGTWAGVQWNPYESHSLWFAGAIFAPANRDKVEQAFAEEVQRASKEGFSSDEVAKGREALLAFRRLDRAQDGRLADSLAKDLQLGRTALQAQRVDDALAGLDAAAVNAALRQQLDASRFVRALAGDFKP